MTNKVVLDWDGTVTEVDSLHMVIERFGDREAYVALEAEVGRTLTLDEVIAAEMATIVAPLDEVVGWLVDNVRIRRGFHELVAAHDPLIVSAGFHETIEPVLRREVVEARVVANHVTADAAGWRAEFAPGAICEVCGERCKRAAVGGLGQFAYVGDVERAVRAFAPRIGSNESAVVGPRNGWVAVYDEVVDCLLYTSPSPRDLSTSRMPSSA